jgi:hypothetical protein
MSPGDLIPTNDNWWLDVVIGPFNSLVSVTEGAGGDVGLDVGVVGVVAFPSSTLLGGFVAQSTSSSHVHVFNLTSNNVPDPQGNTVPSISPYPSHCT